MKTATLSTAVLFAFLSNMGLAGHDAGRYRRLDDLAFGATALARELRWEIHDDFDSSRDYRYLLRDADKLAEEIQHIVGAIWAERPDHVICREIDSARNALNTLAARLDACDFAYVSEGCYKPVSAGRGYAFAPPTRHAGYVHVLTARRLMVQIDTSLCAIHNELSGGHLVPYSATPALPAPVVVPGPALNPGVHKRPGSALQHTVPNVVPTVPAVNVPRIRETGSSSRSIELPLFGDKSGGIVLQFGR